MYSAPHLKRPLMGSMCASLIFPSGLNNSVRWLQPPKCFLVVLPISCFEIVLSTLHVLSLKINLRAHGQVRLALNIHSVSAD